MIVSVALEGGVWAPITNVVDVCGQLMIRWTWAHLHQLSYQPLDQPPTKQPPV